MQYELDLRFPKTRSLLAERLYKTGYKEHIVKVGKITYDSSYMPAISPDILQLFIDYQTHFPEKIKECVQIFYNILELQENELNLRDLTGEEVNKNIVYYRKQKTQEYMQQIREILEFEYHVLMGKSMLEPFIPHVIDSWIEFIKAQHPLNAFY